MRRALRRHRTETIVRRRVRFWLRSGGEDERVDDFFRGRCRTLAPLDCGRPRCGVCAKEKYRFTRTLAKRRAHRDMAPE